MKTIDLVGSVRTDSGKKFAKLARKSGQVPAVIYGGEHNMCILLNAKELAKAIITPNVYIVNITVDGKQYPTVVKEAQFHPVNDSILHVDFLEVVKGKPVTVAIPVVLVGQSEGAKQGGKLVQMIRKVRVSGEATNIPDIIEIDVTSLTIGKSIMVGDLNFADYQVVESKSLVIATVKTTRAVVETTGEETAAPAAAPTK